MLTFGLVEVKMKIEEINPYSAIVDIFISNIMYNYDIRPYWCYLNSQNAIDQAEQEKQTLKI